MFGASNPFGQGSNSSSPFGSQTQSVFGQNNNSAASNNPFAPKPFGASSPFGAQSGGSMFGGTSTGVFGQPQASSPFGASSQGFGSSTPSFGAPSASAFGNSPSPFGGTSTFGQNGFSTPQSSPFGSTTQQSQPAFGNSTFGSSTPFGTSSTPAFGSTNTSAFGAPSTSAFGSTNTSAFGAPSTSAFGAPSTSAFGSTNTSAFGAPSTSAFGSTNTSAFGNSGSAFGNNAFGSGNAFGTPSTSGFGAPSTSGFGAPSTSGFGAPSTSAFGAPNNSAFGAPSTSAFGAPSTSAFGAPSTSGFGAPSTSGFGAPNNSAFGAPTTSAFGAPTTSAFGFGSSPAFGQSTQSPFGAQGAQASTSNFGNQQGGSRVTPYAATVDTDSGTGTPGKFQSISAMPVYKDKCHEELRWDDYQRGDKGGKLPPGQTSAFSQTPPNPFGQPSSNPSQAFQSTIAPNPSLFGQPSSNPTNTFQSSPNLFSQNTPATNTNFSSPFGQPTTPSLFATSSNTSSGFGQSSGFATTTTQPFGSSPSLFSSTPAQGSTPAFSNGNFNNSQSAPLFSSNPSFAQTNSGFGQTQPSIFSTPSTGFPNMSTSSPALNTSVSPFGQTQPAGVTPNQPTQPSFNFNNSGQNQAGGLGFGQVNYGQVPAMANPIATQPIPVTNPFGTLPAVPQVSIGQGGYSPPIQYGISSMPVVDRVAPARVSPLISRHLLRRRVMPSVRKYRPVDDSPRVPFFSDEENSDTPKADASIIPRENPRALLILGLKKKIAAPLKDETTPLQENGKRSNGVLTNGANNENKKNGEVRDAPPVKAKEKLNVAHENHGGDKNGSKSSPSSAEIESVLPKLYNGEYFTEPRIHVLAAKERADPGYTGRVRDFVVGRHGFGSIKFLGESDLRKLNLEKLIQFNKREVLVYMDESQKPPVGEGLNKPAEVTLLNIKCMDKKSGQQVKEGPMVEKYLEMLKRKAEEQGAQFVSYDAVNGEWKFKVEHF